MSKLHKNQEKILDLLLEYPEGLGLSELSEKMNISKSAVKEHILKIDALGFIRFIDSTGGIGRPKRKYLLTDEGHDVLPKQYSWLSSTILEYLLEDMGEKETAKIMKGLASKVYKSMEARFTTKPSFLEKLTELSNTLNELGYRARVKQSDLRKGAIIEATNCVYHSVAKDHPELCQFDILFIEKSTNTNVVMESCIAKGGATCRFCLTKK